MKPVTDLKAPRRAVTRFNFNGKNYGAPISDQGNTVDIEKLLAIHFGSVDVQIADPVDGVGVYPTGDEVPFTVTKKGQPFGSGSYTAGIVFTSAFNPNAGAKRKAQVAETRAAAAAEAASIAAEGIKPGTVEPTPPFACGAPDVISQLPPSVAVVEAGETIAA